MTVEICMHIHRLSDRTIDWLIDRLASLSSLLLWLLPVFFNQKSENPLSFFCSLFWWLALRLTTWRLGLRTDSEGFHVTLAGSNLTSISLIQQQQLPLLVLILLLGCRPPLPLSFLFFFVFGERNCNAFERLPSSCRPVACISAQVEAATKNPCRSAYRKRFLSFPRPRRLELYRAL